MVHRNNHSSDNAEVVETAVAVFVKFLKFNKYSPRFYYLPDCCGPIKPISLYNISLACREFRIYTMRQKRGTNCLFCASLLILDRNWHFFVYIKNE